MKSLSKGALIASAAALSFSLSLNAHAGDYGGYDDETKTAKKGKSYKKKTAAKTDGKGHCTSKKHVKCKGINSCTGSSDCKGNGSTGPGKNGCGGVGFNCVPAKVCTSKKGTVI